MTPQVGAYRPRAPVVTAESSGRGTKISKHTNQTIDLSGQNSQEVADDFSFQDFSNVAARPMTNHVEKRSIKLSGG